jgi:hypothetical protein
MEKEVDEKKEVQCRAADCSTPVVVAEATQ